MSALEHPPSPGYITRLREGLGLTQKELGLRIGVDKMTVSRWERGTLRPSGESLAALEKARREAVRKGVALPT
jgi:transcriptional regulator with XRE-family HTH domain